MVLEVSNAWCVSLSAFRYEGTRRTVELVLARDGSGSLGMVFEFGKGKREGKHEREKEWAPAVRVEAHLRRWIVGYVDVRCRP